MFVKITDVTSGL